jgi:recombination protein RecT
MTDLATRLAQGRAKRPELPSGQEPAGQMIRGLIEDQADQLAVALPEGMDVERFIRVVLTEIRRTPKLSQCTSESLIGAFMLTAQLGLMPGPGYAHVYLIPRRNKNNGNRLEVSWQLGYRGMVELARRSGAHVEAFTIHEGDTWAFAEGVGEGRTYVHHTWPLTNRGEPIAAWAKVTHPDGHEQFVVLDADELARRRARSESGGTSPWKSDFGAMARKSGIRMLEPYLPKSPALARAIAADDGVATFDASATDADVAVEVDEVPDAIEAEAVEEDPVGELPTAAQVGKMNLGQLRLVCGRLGVEPVGTKAQIRDAVIAALTGQAEPEESEAERLVATLDDAAVHVEIESYGAEPDEDPEKARIQLVALLNQQDQG